MSSQPLAPLPDFDKIIGKHGFLCKWDSYRFTGPSSGWLYKLDVALILPPDLTAHATPREIRRDYFAQAEIVIEYLEACPEIRGVVDVVIEVKTKYHGCEGNLRVELEVP